MRALLIALLALMLFVAAQGVPRIRGVRIATGGGSFIASSYPGDVGIAADTDVIFNEEFEEASVAAMRANWTDGRLLVSDFSTDVATGSPMGSKSFSLNREWFGLVDETGGDHIYKRIPEHDEVWVRAYFKYSGALGPSHSGIWMGGYNPALDFADPQSGTPADGVTRFIAGWEPVTYQGVYRMETYDYYYGQRSSHGDWLMNKYDGNPDYHFPWNEWLCHEMRIKVNTPTGSPTGEQQVWINGVEKGNYGQGYPLGIWWSDIWFEPGAGSTPFGGFQWRTDPALRLNWVWFQNFTGFSDMDTKVLLIDHIVVARRRIGCLS